MMQTIPLQKIVSSAFETCFYVCVYVRMYILCMYDNVFSALGELENDIVTVTVGLK